MDATPDRPYCERGGSDMGWAGWFGCPTARLQENRKQAPSFRTPQQEHANIAAAREYTCRRQRVTLALRWVSTRQIMARIVIPRPLRKAATYDVASNI
jgi:hypothetical protein